MYSSHLWGIDLGGTKIEAAILDAPTLQPIIRKRIPTEADQGYEHILSRIQHIIHLLEEETGLKAKQLGIGTPGAVNPSSQSLINSNTAALRGKKIVQDIKQMLGIPVRIANDANCFALAETHVGVIKQQFPEARMVFGVIMGTGVGGGLVIDGKIWEGKHSIGGEWGHSFLDESGGLCYCGKVGCVETILSGPALEKFYAEQSEKPYPLTEILQRKQDDQAAQQTKERLLHFFGKGMAQLINILDPDVIVIGGGLGNIGDLYTEGKSFVQHFAFHPAITTPIVQPVLGDSAGVFGAAMLFR